MATGEGPTRFAIGVLEDATDAAAFRTAIGAGTGSGGGGNYFGTVAVSGQSDVVADADPDTLTLAAGANIAITTNAGTDTVTIAATGLAASSHTHAPSDITGTAVVDADARLSDARTPTAHTHPASEVSDSTAAGRTILTAADAAAQRTALGVSPSPTGTPDGTKYLRDDNSWQPVSGGSGLTQPQVMARSLGC